MKALQRGSRTVRATLNQHKSQIDALRAEIETKRKAQSSLEMNKTEDGEEIIDEEELNHIVVTEIGKGITDYKIS